MSQFLRDQASDSDEVVSLGSFYVTGTPTPETSFCILPTLIFLGIDNLFYFYFSSHPSPLAQPLCESLCWARVGGWLSCGSLSLSNSQLAKRWKERQESQESMVRKLERRIQKLMTNEPHPPPTKTRTLDSFGVFVPGGYIPTLETQPFARHHLLFSISSYFPLWLSLYSSHWLTLE